MRSICFRAPTAAIVASCVAALTGTAAHGRRIGLRSWLSREQSVPIDKHSSRIWRGRIREILNRDWDPIGGCPDDEYDGYVGKIAAMIRDNAADDQLLAFLEWAEVDHMGLGQPFNRERGEKVVAALRVLGPPPDSN